MNKQNKGAFLKIFVLTLIVIVVAGGFWYYYRNSEVAAPETEIILLPELKWGSYRQIVQAIQGLSRELCWRLEQPGQEARTLSPRENGVLEEALHEALRQELARREALLAEELQLRRQLIEMRIDRLVQQKKNQTDHQNQQALEERRKQQAAELTDYRRRKEKEYASRLATLHFKMAMPDLNPEAKSRLAAEVTALQEELNAEVNAKAAALEEALSDFAAEREAAATRELESYRRSLEAEKEQEYLREKEELEAEFWAWVWEHEGIERFLSDGLEYKGRY